MNIHDFEDPAKKFRTRHRDDMYHVIAENDPTNIFSSMANTFLICFAVGFHSKGMRSVKGTGSINHVNNSAINLTNQDLIIVLMLDRHPDIHSKDELWSMVEEYAEYGICALYESLRRSDWVLDVSDVLQVEESMISQYDS